MASMMGSVAKHVFLVTDPTKLEATMRTAFEIARTGRPGPGGRRYPEGRAELGRAVFRGEGVLPIPGYRRRPRELIAQRARQQMLQRASSTCWRSRSAR